jgi:phosphate starvation-inducible membrane PsiE
MTKLDPDFVRTSAWLRRKIDPLGSLMSDGFHFLGLFAIGAATVWAAVHAFIDMVHKGHASVEDLLLLFIFLEIGAMVGVYFKTNHMPLRFVIYIGITALTRHLIGVSSHEGQPDFGVLILAGCILMLSLAVLVIRYASFHYGSSASPGLIQAQIADSEHEARRSS